MRFDQRVVSQMPLHELWNEHGVVSMTELRELNASDIAELLRMGKVRFIVANIGSKLEWIPLDECFRFWKSEVKNHLADPAADNYLESFPDEYCCFASEWRAEIGEPIVLLKMSH